MKRDFVGYADQPPIVPWPGGARVAVNIALNYEEGDEHTSAFGANRDDYPLL
jgi:hypothetical protein